MILLMPDRNTQIEHTEVEKRTRDGKRQYETVEVEKEQEPQGTNRDHRTDG